jgi:hypothetical protein
MDDVLVFKFTPQGFSYTRRALGGCPHDEVRPLIDNLEWQHREQVQPAAPPAPPLSDAAPPPGPAPVRRLRAVKRERGNGADHSAENAPAS